MQIIIRPYEQFDKSQVCNLLNQTSNAPLGEDMFEMQESLRNIEAKGSLMR